MSKEEILRKHLKGKWYDTMDNKVDEILNAMEEYKQQSEWISIEDYEIDDLSKEYTKKISQAVKIVDEARIRMFRGFLKYIRDKNKQTINS